MLSGRLLSLLVVAAFITSGTAYGFTYSGDPSYSSNDSGAMGTSSNGGGSTPLAAAENLYGSGVQVYQADDSEFAAAFPALDLFAVLEPGRQPPTTHAMVWDPINIEAWDFTTMFNEILASQQVVITQANAMTYAKAYAQAANVEFEVGRKIVYAADSTALGVTITDPHYVFADDGWAVRLTTWNRQNGVVADWEIHFRFLGGLGWANWDVRKIATGPYMPEFEAINLNNTYAMNSYSVLGYTLNVQRDGVAVEVPFAPSTALVFVDVLEVDNFDCSRWLVQWETVAGNTNIPPDIQDLAEEFAEGGRAAYSTMVSHNPNCGTGANTDWNPATNWTFVSEAGPASNPTFTVKIHNLALNLGYNIVIDMSEDNDFVIRTSSDFIAAMRSFGYYADVVDDQKIINVLMAHEVFHSIQWTTTDQAWYDGKWDNSYIEGQARLVQTAYDPETEARTTSTFYSTLEDSLRSDENGVNGFQKNPHKGICDYWYGSALYWGFLYAEEGGMPFIKRMLEEVPSLTSTGCYAYTDEAITDALVALGSTHSTQKDARINFGYSVLKKNFTWGKPNGDNQTNWGTWLLDVDAPDYTGAASHEIGAWGLKYVRKPMQSGKTYSVTCTPSDSPASRWSLEVIIVDTATGSHTIMPCSQATLLQGAGTRTLYARATRLYSQQASFHVSITESGLS